MEKAQWSPINSEPRNDGYSPVAKKQHLGLARMPITFSNTLPMKAKEHNTDKSNHFFEKPPVANSQTPSRSFSASGTESRTLKPREIGSADGPAVNQTNPSTPTTISSIEISSERRVESKKPEMASNGRNRTSTPNLRTGTQTPKANHQVAVAVMSQSTQPQKPAQMPSQMEINRDVYRAFNMSPPEKIRIVSEDQTNAAKAVEPRQSPVKRTPGPSDTPQNITKDSPNEHRAKSHEAPIEIDDNDEQGSSSSEDDAANLSTNVRRTAEEAIEDAESVVLDEQDNVTTANSLPDDHPTEWLKEAREIYQHSLPPFATKHKPGLRRMVELPLAEGQKVPEKVEVVYRSWDALHTFASIDMNGKRFILKAFRGGPTPYRPWLGKKTGFSATALAFANQGPRGRKSWGAIQGNRLALPKGWTLTEDDEHDDDYNPTGRRKLALLRGRSSLNYELNGEEEDLDEDMYQEDSYQVAQSLHSGRSSVEGDFASPNSSGIPRSNSNVSATRPPSKLVNAAKKGLRLPKEKDDFPRPKQIKRRSIGGQGATTDSGVIKPSKHKADFISDSDNPVPHKRTKATKVISHQRLSTNSADKQTVSQASNDDHRAVDPQTLSPYKQAYTTLRIALVPYPQQSAIQRLRSCMTIDLFFSTVIGVSGYKGDKDRIFGITATFDCKPDDDPDKSMVIREDWQDSFDVFLETVNGAESWTEEGGKCGVAVRLLLTDG